MRFYSTPQSANILGVTLLACLESIASASLALWIAWHYQTVNHIAIAALLAPFLLLRTPESTKLGLKWFAGIDTFFFREADFFVHFVIGSISVMIVIWFSGVGLDLMYFIATVIALLGLGLINLRKILSKQLKRILLLLVIIACAATMSGAAEAIGGETPNLTLLGTILFAIIGSFTLGIVVVTIFTSLTIKTVATVVTFIRRPFHSFAAIPNNWLRVTLCTDFFHPPELMPGIESVAAHEDSSFRISKLKRVYLDNTGQDLWEKFFFLMIIFFLFTMYLPSILYRWSLKSTALLYLPLIYVIGRDEEIPSDEGERLLDDKLEALRCGVLGKLKFYYALFALVFLTLLPLCMAGAITDIKYPVGWGPLLVKIADNAKNYFFLLDLKGWHVTRALAAGLTVLLFFYVDGIMRKRKRFEGYGRRVAPRVIRLVFLARRPLALFTIFCGLYLLLSPFSWQEMWDGIQWLPE